MPIDRKKAAGYLRGAAQSPLAKAPALLPLRAAMIGAAGGLDAAPGGSVEDVGLVGAAAPTVESIVDTTGGALEHEISEGPEQAGRLLYGAGIADAKEQRRRDEAGHAAGTAVYARTDPASGTRQGASAPTAGTGTGATRTEETGGVTTGEPGHTKVGVGDEMLDYTPGDPRFEGIADPGDFMDHRKRVAPDAAPAGRRVGPKSGAGHGGHIWTQSTVPQGAQTQLMADFERGVEAKSQDFSRGMAESEAAEAAAGAQEARATALTEEPFLPETIAARSQIGEANIEAATKEAERSDIKAIVAQAAAQVNALKEDPLWISLSPAQQKEAEDRIWEQAQLALSGLTGTNLYPRVNPYEMFGMMGMGAPAAPAEEKQD